jgi:hypothetical protein
MPISFVSVLTGVSASNPELGGFRFIALHCGNDGPPLRAPYLLGSDTNCGQGDKVEDRAHEAAVLYHQGSKQSPYLAAGDEGPVAF